MRHFLSSLLLDLLLARTAISTALVLTALLVKTDITTAQEHLTPDCAGGSCPSPSSRPDKPICDLWLGPSPIKEAEEHGFGLGVFTGRNIPEGSSVEMEGELLIPIFDSALDNHPPLREYVWDGVLMPEIPMESETGAYLFMPGLAGIAPCTDQNYNAEWTGPGNSPDSLRHNIAQDNAGVHRSTHPSAGSFSYRHKMTYTAVRDIVAGEELTVKCSDDAFDGGAYYLSNFHTNDNAVACIDNLAHADSSTIAGIGQGLFASRPIAKNSVITSSPLIPIHRKEMDHQIEGRSVGKQLLLNYCYGHARSDLLLLPYGPLANYINHPTDANLANAVIRWHPSDDNQNDNLPRRQQHHHPELLDLSGETVAETHGKGLMMDIVALRDILPNEEIFIDYGRDWEDAWKAHVDNWKSSDKNYVSASDYNRAHEQEAPRTVAEEESDPYPENLQTACFFDMGTVQEAHEVVRGGETVVTTSWNERATHTCLRPCIILERHGKGGEELYKAKMLPINDNEVYQPCVLDKNYVVKNVPRKAMRIVDRPYTSDTFLDNAFRHEMGVPDGFFPEKWMKKNVRRRSQATQADGDGDSFKRKKTRIGATTN